MSIPLDPDSASMARLARRGGLRRWVICALTVGLALFLSLYLLQDADLAMYEEAAYQAGKTGTPDDRIHLILIDEASAREVLRENNGQFPRSLFSRIATFCDSAKVVAFDVYFEGRKRVTDDVNFAKLVETHSERGLASIISGLFMEPGRSEVRTNLLRFAASPHSGRFPDAKQYRDPVEPYKELLENPHTQLGHVVYRSYGERILRRYAVVAQGTGAWFPSLALTTLRAGSNTVNWAGRRIECNGNSVHLDAGGEFLFRHYDTTYTFSTLQDVFDSINMARFHKEAFMHTGLAKAVDLGTALCRKDPEWDPRHIKMINFPDVIDKYVLVGSSAKSVLEDSKSTAYDEETPGVYIHAWALDNLLNGNQFWDAPLWVNVLLTCVLGFFPAIVFNAPRRMIVLGLAVLVLYLLGVYALAVFANFLLPQVAPSLAILFATTAMALVSWSVEQGQRRELQAMEQAKQEFTDFLVHDLKGQINAMDMSLSLLEEQVPIEGSTGRVFTALQSGMNRLLAQTHNLLDIRKIEQGKMQMTPQLASLHDLMREVVSEYAGAAELVELQIAPSFDPAFDRPVLIDEDLFRRILGNLVWNAIQYAKRGTSIEVATRMLPDNQFSVHVANHGNPISPEVQSTLFQPFASGNSTDQSKNVRTVSTGLGLLFCQMATEAHGGTIKLQSPWVNGQGVIVTLSLPVESTPFATLEARRKAASFT